jgi:hypothetical protein
VTGMSPTGPLERRLGVHPRGALNTSSRGRECPARLGLASPDLIPTIAPAAVEPDRGIWLNLRSLRDGVPTR